LYKVGCSEDSDLTESTDEQTRELLPQIRLNVFKHSREDFDDDSKLNTIDPIQWTTGIQNFPDESFSALIKEFGNDVFTSTHLNVSRGFAYGNGDFSDGFATGGYKNIYDEETESLIPGYSQGTEVWNGTSWSYFTDQPSVERSNGLAGGNSKISATAYGVSLTFGDPDSSVPTNFSNSDSNLYVRQQSTSGDGSYFWTLITDISCPQPKHSVAGVLKITQNDASEQKLKDKIYGERLVLGTPVVTCITAGDSLEGIDPSQIEEINSIISVSGIAYNGSTGDVKLYGLSCEDISDEFHFLSYLNGYRKYFDTELNEIVEESVNTGCWLVDTTRKYPIKTVGTCYVGNELQGLSTGGKTCYEINNCSDYNTKVNTLNGYFDSELYDEFNSSVINLVYENNGTSWIRRENMAESLAYHVGVGNEENCIFWGGLHGSVERINTYVYIPECDDWSGILEAFGGSFYKYGSLGLDGEVRYADFATLKLDEFDNTYYKVGDSRDEDGNGIKLSEQFINSGETTQLTAYNILDYLSDVYTGHKKKVAYSDYENNTITVVEFTNGEGWISNSITSESPLEQIAGDNNESVERWLGSISGNEKIFDGTYNFFTNTESAFTSGNFAQRDNYLNNLITGYSTHPTTGGMWLWSRPNIGESLFHPENVVPPSGDTWDNCDWISRGFSSETSGCSGQSKSYYISKNGEGFDQVFWKSRDSYVERWENKFLNEMANESF
jgi:hypothetical protein